MAAEASPGVARVLLVSILVMVILAVALAIRASWVWFMRERDGVSRLRGTAGSLAISLVLLDCWYFAILFCRGEIGGFETHYVTTRMVGWYFWASIAVTAVAWLVKGESRRETLIAGMLVTALWLGSGFVA
jgi:hypothetical protein